METDLLSSDDCANSKTTVLLRCQMAYEAGVLLCMGALSIISEKEDTELAFRVRK